LTLLCAFVFVLVFKEKKAAAERPAQV